MTPDEITALIDSKIQEALAFSANKLGDTPTDALQLTPKKYVDAGDLAAKVYRGHVSNAGSGTLLPTGWTSSVTSTLYTITHNLGISDYAVTVTARADANSGNPAADICFPVIGATSSNSFTVAFFTNDNTTTKIATDFNFMLKTS